MGAVKRICKEAHSRNSNRECCGNVNKLFYDTAQSVSPLAPNTAAGSRGKYYRSAARPPRTLDKVYGHHLQ